MAEAAGTAIATTAGVVPRATGARPGQVDAIGRLTTEATPHVGHGATIQPPPGVATQPPLAILEVIGALKRSVARGRGPAPSASGLGPLGKPRPLPRAPTTPSRVRRAPASTVAQTLGKPPHQCTDTFRGSLGSRYKHKGAAAAWSRGPSYGTRSETGTCCFSCTSSRVGRTFSSRCRSHAFAKGHCQEWSTTHAKRAPTAGGYAAEGPSSTARCCARASAHRSQGGDGGATGLTDGGCPTTR